MANVSKLTIIKESANAIQVRQKQARDTQVEAWLPRSQIDYMRKLGRDSNGLMEIVVTIPSWLAEEKQLDYD